MQKIKLNDEHYLNFLNSIEQDSIQLIGIYGCFQSALDITSHFLNIPRPQESSIPSAFNEGIIFFKTKEKAVAIYKSPNDEVTYSYDSGTD